MNRGLARSRELIDRIENYAPSAAETPAIQIAAMAAHAQAIAAVSLAESARLSALVEVARISGEGRPGFVSEDQLARIQSEIDLLIGLPPGRGNTPLP